MDISCFANNSAYIGWPKKNIPNFDNVVLRIGELKIVHTLHAQTIMYLQLFIQMSKSHLKRFMRYGDSTETGRFWEYPSWTEKRKFKFTFGILLLRRHVLSYNSYKFHSNSVKLAHSHSVLYYWQCVNFHKVLLKFVEITTFCKKPPLTYIWTISLLKRNVSDIRRRNIFAI